MRLNKFISETGVCSRRQADSWIEAGRVSVNGTVAVLGTQVADGDTVCVDGKPVGAAKAHVYLALNKPVGITCTTERHIAGNIIDFIRHRERIFPIGRLDKESEGLILLTNHGDIVNEVLRVEHGHEKEYRVTVDKPIDAAFIAGMSAGVWLPELETRTLPCTVEPLLPRPLRGLAPGAPRRDSRHGLPATNSFTITLKQGLNRQIRRMCEVFGYKVLRLQRVRIINVRLGDLKPGQWRELTDDELRGLLPQRFDR
jgi:23S rRNA pseudouridine2604 synthase